MESLVQRILNGFIQSGISAHWPVNSTATAGGCLFNDRGIRNNPHGGEVVYRKIIRGGWLFRLLFLGRTGGGSIGFGVGIRGDFWGG